MNKTNLLFLVDIQRKLAKCKVFPYEPESQFDQWEDATFWYGCELFGQVRLLVGWHLKVAIGMSLSISDCYGIYSEVH